MNVLVTGASGFIGSHLVESLVACGHRVVNVDVAPSRASVPTLRVDVGVPGGLHAALRDTDAVFHLAGFVQAASNDRVLDAYRTHVQGTLNLLQSCVENRVPWFGLASTFLLYQAATGEGEVDEESAIDPARLDPFTSSKLGAELAVTHLARRHEIRYAILRYGSAYGTPEASNVIGEFMRCLRRGEPIRVWGDGSRRTQFTHVRDLAEGSVLALQGPSGTYNLVSPEAMSVAEVAIHFRDRYGAEVLFERHRSQPPPITFVSSEKARRVLDWRPVDLACGVARSLNSSSGDGAEAAERT